MKQLHTFESYLSILENTSGFLPEYFSLPYSIPEDRFEGGLLKSNTSRRTSIRRKIQKSGAKYSSQKEFFDKNSVEVVEKKVLSEINRVVKFINNNKLTGKLLEAEFEQEAPLDEYLRQTQEEEDEDVVFGMIYTNLPFSTFSIRVDYDLYKDIPVFTFWMDGDLFYYYGIFTLEPNDVVGSGEYHTYITADEVIDYLFYESIWRAAFYDLNQMATEPEVIGYSESEFERLAEFNPNDSKSITDDYLNKKFVKFLKNWIKNGDPFNESEEIIVNESSVFHSNNHDNTEAFLVKPNAKLKEATGYPFALFYLSTQAKNIAIDFTDDGHISLIKMLAEQEREIKENNSLKPSSISKGRQLFKKVLGENVSYSKYDGADCYFRLKPTQRSAMSTWEWFEGGAIAMENYI